MPHKFYADFIVYYAIILEVKSVKEISNDHLAQTLNYMKLVDTPIGIITNFQNKSLVHKRLINS
ncbi:GxxExxY protein [Flavobacterium restrictum]|uniref:GxxExxY protein n=1 Tax=Flavobacterium restrictum TaxID=2594428 RepID=UPI002938DC13|nr:GxxExxY protein [Flavobacterium restrictum]